MSDPHKPGFDPQQQANNPQEDQELTKYLVEQEGHNEESAKQEIKDNREAVKQRHRKHKEKHGQR